jgi:hypothetical protein
MTTNVFDAPAAATGTQTVLRVAGEPDVMIDRDGRPSFAGPNGIDADESRLVEFTPAERTLRLWGRHPTSHPAPPRFITHGGAPLRLPSQQIHHAVPVLR